MPTNVRLILRVARELRYRELGQLIGQRVQFESLAHIHDAVLTIAKPWGATEWSPASRAELALAKYGLVDARIDVPKSALDDATTRVGLEVLRDNGFAPPLSERREFNPEDGNCAEELAADLDRPTAVLKLMLRDPAHTSPDAAKLGNRLPVLPPDYFPRDFVIDDACITNCDFIWLLKQFYL